MCYTPKKVSGVMSIYVLYKWLNSDTIHIKKQIEICFY